MMKETCNVIEQEAWLATPSQRKIFSGTTFAEDYLHVKNLKYQLIPSRDTYDRKTLQFSKTLSHVEGILKVKWDLRQL